MEGGNKRKQKEKTQKKRNERSKEERNAEKREQRKGRRTRGRKGRRKRRETKDGRENRPAETIRELPRQAGRDEGGETGLCRGWIERP